MSIAVRKISALGSWASSEPAAGSDLEHEGGFAMEKPEDDTSTGVTRREMLETFGVIGAAAALATSLEHISEMP